jgi:pentatricopeptide repeat protein
MRCEGVEIDKIGFVCALDACGGLEAGKELHVSLAECGYVQDAVVGTALLTMYGRHRSVGDAKLVFQSIVHRDRSCWNAMLTALTQNHAGKEALDLFRRMQCAGEKPDIITFVCVLDGCASVSTTLGQVVHASIVEHGIDVEHVLGTALVDMYGKYGNLDDAFCVFSKAPRTNVISWNAIISVFAQNGYGSKSLDLFDRMQRQCIRPDYTTLVSVLTACSHGGLVNLGWYFFVYMDGNYGIERTIGHCCCMIDLLGRAGHLEQAELLLNQIPLEADDTTWRSLLGACKMHSDVERGIRIANRCLALHPADAALYVTLLNLHAISGNEAWQKTQSCEDLFVG